MAKECRSAGILSMMGRPDAWSNERHHLLIGFVREFMWLWRRIYGIAAYIYRIMGYIYLIHGVYSGDPWGMRI
jgi:hypothetical protein